MGMADLVVVMEGIGTGLAPEPFLHSTILGGQLLASSENKALIDKWLDPYQIR